MVMAMMSKLVSTVTDCVISLVIRVLPHPRIRIETVINIPVVLVPPLLLLGWVVDYSFVMPWLLF